MHPVPDVESSRERPEGGCCRAVGALFAQINLYGITAVVGMIMTSRSRAPSR